jgi:TolB protein
MGESHVRQLTYNNASDRDPVWSPDGFWIAYTGDGDGDDEIYLVDAEGRYQAS